MFFNWIKKRKSTERSALETSQRPQVGVRLEAIGGQGAHSAGKILAEAAVLGESYTGNHFSSFGSEKRGTHVRSYVRFSTMHKPIRTASAIKTPDVLVIFHDQLIHSHPEIFEGCSAQTDIIINTRTEIENLIFPLQIQCKSVALLDAEKISLKFKCGINAVMLGAVAEFLPEIQKNNLQKYLDLFFQKLPPDKKKANLQGFETGSEQIELFLLKDLQKQQDVNLNQKPDWGWMNAPLGGVILEPGNSYLKDNSASRKGSAPVLNRDICFNCGFCDMVCPDFCFVWDLDPE